jgi:hypothetical protein
MKQIGMMKNEFAKPFSVAYCPGLAHRLGLSPGWEFDPSSSGDSGGGVPG